jgi:histidine phosphotransferase ChpT
MNISLHSSGPTAESEPDLIALLSSRICHDLVSPVGAIANGLELLEIAHGESEEMTLIRSSVDSAMARLRFFRMAFGIGRPEQVVAARDVISILQDMYRDSRTSVYWTDDEDRPRTEVRLALLGLLCVEVATPWGGRVEVGRNAAAWTIHVDADRLRIDQTLWEAFGTKTVPSKLRGAEVQFGVLMNEAKRLRRPVSVTADETQLSMVI